MWGSSQAEGSARQDCLGLLQALLLERAVGGPELEVHGIVLAVRGDVGHGLHYGLPIVRLCLPCLDLVDPVCLLLAFGALLLVCLLLQGLHLILGVLLECVELCLGIVFFLLGLLLV